TPGRARGRRRPRRARRADPRARDDDPARVALRPRAGGPAGAPGRSREPRRRLRTPSRATAPGVTAPLLECVPNVSDGRDRALIEALAAAVEAAGARPLDVHAGVDHNRPQIGK